MIVSLLKLYRSLFTHTLCVFVCAFLSMWEKELKLNVAAPTCHLSLWETEAEPT